MSATLCVETYRKYFDVEEDAIFVGVKRFPLTEHHLDDIAQMNTFPRMIQSRAQNLITRMKNIRVSERVNKTLADNQVKIAVDVAKAVSKPGRSVLIFVAGIYTIGQIAEEFEKCPGRVIFLCFVFSVNQKCAPSILHLVLSDTDSMRKDIGVRLSLLRSTNARDMHCTVTQIFSDWWQFTHRLYCMLVKLSGSKIYLFNAILPPDNLLTNHVHRFLLKNSYKPSKTTHLEPR